MTGVTIAPYPDGVDTAGPIITLLRVKPIDFEVDMYPNEDGTRDVNIQPCGNLRFELDYDNLTASEYSTLLNHWSLAKGKINNFSFYNRQDGATYTGCQYASFTVPPTPKRWLLSARIVLVKYT